MNKLLVVVDYQNDFVDGSLGFDKAKELEEGIYNRTQEYLDNGDNVVFTVDAHEPNYLSTREGQHLPVKHCINGTYGCQIYGKLNDVAKKPLGVMNLYKNTFGVNPLMLGAFIYQLPPRCVNEIEFCGVCTDICVLSNVVIFQSCYPEAQIIVNKNLCASFDEDLHNKALEIMEKSLQVKII